MPNSYPEFFTVRGVAEFFGCSTAKVYRLIKKGDLKATQECLGASFSISKNAICDYLGYVPEAFKLAPTVKREVVFVQKGKAASQKRVFSRRRVVKISPRSDSRSNITP